MLFIVLFGIVFVIPLTVFVLRDKFEKNIN